MIETCLYKLFQNKEVKSASIFLFFTQISYYLEKSFISLTRESSVRNIIRHPDRSLFGYGSDSGGGSTVELLEYVIQQYGSIASFTGCYRADYWSLNIEGTGALEQYSTTSEINSNGETKFDQFTLLMMR